jgi:hypothetical protein
MPQMGTMQVGADINYIFLQPQNRPTSDTHHVKQTFFPTLNFRYLKCPCQELSNGHTQQSVGHGCLFRHAPKQSIAHAHLMGMNGNPGRIYIYIYLAQPCNSGARLRDIAACSMFEFSYAQISNCYFITHFLSLKVAFLRTGIKLVTF